MNQNYFCSFLGHAHIIVRTLTRPESKMSRGTRRFVKNQQVNYDPESSWMSKRGDIEIRPRKFCNSGINSYLTAKDKGNVDITQKDLWLCFHKL